jgi:hypothetical protein
VATFAAATAQEMNRSNLRVVNVLDNKYDRGPSALPPLPLQFPVPARGAA